MPRNNKNPPIQVKLFDPARLPTLLAMGVQQFDDDGETIRLTIVRKKAKWLFDAMEKNWRPPRSHDWLGDDGVAFLKAHGHRPTEYIARKKIKVSDAVLARWIKADCPVFTQNPSTGERYFPDQWVEERMKKHRRRPK